MATITIPMIVPEDMAPYLNNMDSGDVFARNAMLLYPFIRNLTISHGRAAEILGVGKWELIRYYDSLGIPYLNQSKEEMMNDVASLDRVLGAV